MSDREPDEPDEARILAHQRLHRDEHADVDHRHRQDAERRRRRAASRRARDRQHEGDAEQDVRQGEEWECRAAWPPRWSIPRACAGRRPRRLRSAQGIPTPGSSKTPRQPRLRHAAGPLHGERHHVLVEVRRAHVGAALRPRLDRAVVQDQHDALVVAAELGRRRRDDLLFLLLRVDLVDEDVERDVRACASAGSTCVRLPSSNV